jgi:rare lipoprotein A
MNKDIISVLLIAVSISACSSVDTKKNETIAAITPKPVIKKPIVITKKTPTITVPKVTNIAAKPKPAKPKPSVRQLAKKPSRIVRNYMAKGSASKYRLGDNGIKTASGEIYDLYGMTAAHASLPFYTKVRVKNLANGRSVVVTITDRLYDNNKLIKLSYWAARNLKVVKTRSPRVLVKTF